MVGGLADVDEQPQADGGPSAQARIAAVLGAQLRQLVCLVDDRGTVCWAGTAPATPLADAICALVGADLETVLPPSLVDDWLALVDQVFASSEEATARFDWPLGKESEAVEVTMARFDKGRAVALFRPAEVIAVDEQHASAAPPQPRLPLDLLAGLGLPLLVLSPSGRVEGATEPMIKHLRLPLEIMAGRSLPDEAAGAANRARLEAALAAVLAAPGSPIEAELSLDADRWPVPEFRIQLAALERPEGGMYLLGMLLEPREAPAPQGPSRPDAVPLDMILEGLSEAVITVDAAGVVEWASGAAERMLGRRGETLVGQPIEPLFERAENDGQRLLESLVGEWPASAAARELRARRTNGELFPVEVTGRAFGKGRRRFALVVRDLTLRVHTEETLARLAYHDTLTGLPNRILFHDRLAQAVERGRRTRQMFAVMLVGLDRFKIINNSLGLEKGDQVLKAVAERLAQAVRSSDTVARLGGDEFLLLLAGIESAEAVAKVAQKLLVALRPPLAVGGHELTAAASIGVALFPHDGDTPETLIKNADTALSRAKEQGRSHFQFYTTDMNATAIERLMLESRLRRALENGEFVVYYQPQASLETGAIVGVEALIRWIDPVLGLVPPSDFIPVAEETGLIVEVGSWVLRTAAAEMAHWHRRLGRTDLRLAVNLSGRQFQQADLVEMVRRTLAETGLRPSSLELEITESVVMREATASVRRAERADRPRCAPGDRRLRHRLLVALLPPHLSDPVAQDRPHLHPGHRPRPQLRDLGAGRRRARTEPWSQARRRGCGDGPPADASQGLRLPRDAGLPSEPTLTRRGSPGGARARAYACRRGRLSVGIPAPLVDPRCLAAVDGYGRALNVPCPLRAEEERQLGNVLGLAETLQAGVPDLLGTNLLYRVPGRRSTLREQLLDAIGLGQPRQDGVDVDAAPLAEAGQGLREVGHRRVDGTADHEPGIGRASGTAIDVDDMPACRLEHRPEQPAEADTAEEFEVEAIAPELVR